MQRMDKWERPWCWERLKAGGEGDDRRWDGWMASSTQWTWIWVDSGSWWWTGRPGVLQFMGLQRVGHDWATNWTELNWEGIGEQRISSFVASGFLFFFVFFGFSRQGQYYLLSKAVFNTNILERKLKTLAITAFAHKMYGSWRDPQKILICTSSIINHLACSKDNS